ncbi:MAG: MaoC family dehydratase N-terminal domain-containing protein [Rhodobiaceae bacterium]|nr:MaoC family dehydratase N-terminal domain-containing protein [Rhodobiaceae bacterium]MCC0056197.1 MaoC family dehydratase N-terminal domain-containing protein [Rhodobiaceae bacterium]
MTINEQELLNRAFPELSFSVSQRDAIIYGLGIGLGEDPLNEDQLRFVYEEGLQVFPTMPVVLGSPGMWFGDAGLNWRKLVHAEQSLTNHRPIKIGEPLRAKAKVIDLIDKGAEKGAIMYVERAIYTPDGEPVANLVSGYMLRGDGGYGGKDRKVETSWKLPEREPDAVAKLNTLPQSALIYRLSGDMNPLHADPKSAVRSGFDRPILHGLCTYGLMGRAVLESFCNYDPARLRAVSGRFSKPVYPGDTIAVRMWRDGSEIIFDASVQGREGVVFNQGLAAIS